jgi:MFS family permease
MRTLLALLLLGSAAGLQSGSAAALQPAGTSRKGAPLLHSGSRHPVLLAAARKPASAPAPAENPARPLQLTAFVFVLGLSLVTLTPAKEVTTRMGTEAGMRLLTLLTTGSAAAEIALSPLVGSLTDSVGRKPVLLFTCFSVFAVNLATAVWPTVPLIALSKLVSSLVVGIFFLAAGAILADRLRDDPAKLAAASGSLFAVVNGGFGVGIAASELLPSGLRWRYGISALISLLGFGLAARVRESLSDEDRLPFQVRSFNPFAFTRLFFMSRAMSLLALLSVLTLLPIFMGDTLQATPSPNPSPNPSPSPSPSPSPNPSPSSNPSPYPKPKPKPNPLP